MASEDKKKVVGLDTVWVFKDYIDKVRKEIATTEISDVLTYFDTEIKKVTDNIKSEYDSQYDELNKRLDYVEQFGTPEEVEQIRSQLNALTTNTNNKFANLDKLNKDLEILSGEYEDIKNSVFTEGQINELINAAMIEGVTIMGDGIAAENIYASKLVAFIADFGKISAANIEAGDITGHTIASGDVIPGTDIPRWKIGNEGEGWLANKQISWNENGDVTFGELVKIKWDNVDEKPEIPEGGLTESEKEEIITTVIDRSGITTETITGKTIQSSESISEKDTDPTWQITNTGTGYLAKKNISWDENGNLSANINGSFSGGNNGNVGDDVMSWDENNIYFKKNIVFDDDCVLTWGSSGDTSSGGEKPGAGDGLTEERVTEITKNLISTETIVAENMITSCLNTSAANEPETFQPIYNVEDHVEIENNYIRVRTFENEDVVTISSDEVQNYFSPDSFKVTSDIDGNEGFITFQFIQMGNGMFYNRSAIDQSELSLGFIDTNGYANVHIQLRLVKVGTGAVDTQYYTLNPTASFASQPRIQILKYDPVNDTYIVHSQINITGWNNTEVPSGFDTSEAYTFWTKTIKVEPMNRGIYKVKLILPANSIESTNVGSGNYQLRTWYSITDVNRGTGSFSVIGKNGVSLMSENCNIFMNDDKIELTAGNLRINPDFPSLYGIKITPNGMYINNGGTSWQAWNPIGSSGTTYDDTELTNTVNDLQTRMTTAEQEIDNIQDALSN